MMVAGQLVREVAERLSETGIRVMPLKGALLQKTAYAHAPERRSIVDADVLLSRYGGLSDLGPLLAHGYAVIEGTETVRGVALRTPWGLNLDVHGALYDRWVFRVSTRELFERGSEDEALFGTRVTLPCPLDLYAHLVGHYAKGRLHPGHAHLADLSAVALHYQLDADACARRLVEGGLARAARYSLPLSVAQCDDGFASKVLARLPPDPLGDAIARLAARSLASSREQALSKFVVGHLLNTSIPRACLAMGARGRARLRREVRKRTRV